MSEKVSGSARYPWLIDKMGVMLHCWGPCQSGYQVPHLPPTNFASDMVHEGCCAVLCGTEQCQRGGVLFSYLVVGCACAYLLRQTLPGSTSSSHIFVSCCWLCVCLPPQPDTAWLHKQQPVTGARLLAACPALATSMACMLGQAVHTAAPVPCCTQPPQATE